MTRIALLPLDERPVNTRYPQLLAQIAGAEVVMPPEEIRGQGREPADVEAVTQWLRQTAPGCAGVVASVEFLAYGNLINSRISDHSAAEALPRVAALEAIGRTGTPVYAFSLITRVSNADDCVEEPLFWKTFGTRFYRYSQLLHRRAAGEDAEGIEALEAELPAAERRDWLNRRLRNHTVNLALLDLVARQRLDLLLLTSDDTSTWGLPSREKAWLESWWRLLGDDVAGRVLIHPGADEVGSALVTRMLCAARGAAPRIHPLYAVPGGQEIVAPYEDRAVRLTVEGQIAACGGVVCDDPDSADILLGVLPPSPRRTEWRESFAQTERQEREPFYRAHFETLGRAQDEGRLVSIGDVAYPNGADPLAIDLLLDPACPLDPARLAAYGAWNTAGNTLGTTVAQAICRWLGGDSPVQSRFLLHRFLEDWGYQAGARRDARQGNTAAWGRHDPDPQSPDEVAAAAARVEAALGPRLARLQERGIGTGWTVTPGSVKLPWRRTFEVDFALEPSETPSKE